jgi:hypothetical protein
MQRLRYFSLQHLLGLLAVLLVWKVMVAVLLEYRNYVPPNFGSDFLRGRESYFWGTYAWAFYVHLVAGPPSLLIGTVLVSDRLRRAFPLWHRWLGRIEAGGVLLLLAPSGLWMAYHAATGAIAAVGLSTLALTTAASAALGWRAARQRRFACHRRWMWRTFLLLCSAVVIRLLGGLATVANWDAVWLYPLSAWVSWLVPFVVFEVAQRLKR